MNGNFAEDNHLHSIGKLEAKTLPPVEKNAGHARQAVTQRKILMTRGRQRKTRNLARNRHGRKITAILQHGPNPPAQFSNSNAANRQRLPTQKTKSSHNRKALRKNRNKTPPQKPKPKNQLKVDFF
jgi:hypothetical protein